MDLDPMGWGLLMPKQPYANKEPPPKPGAWESPADRDALG